MMLIHAFTLLIRSLYHWSSGVGFDRTCISHVAEKGNATVPVDLGNSAVSLLTQHSSLNYMPAYEVVTALSTAVAF